MQNRLGWEPEGGRVLEIEMGFRGRKRHLEEEVEALGHCALFYPKF